MPKPKQADKNYIAVMGKIFAVLEFFICRGAKQEPVAFAAISKELSFAPTTIHRILYSLEKLGYVEKAEANAHYRLGAKFFELTGPALHFRHLQSVARSEMQGLLIRHGETVNLGALDGGLVTHIEVVQSLASLRIAASPGECNPVHCTSLGKAILAFLPESEVIAILDAQPLARRTPKTITRRTHLLEHLASVREQGVAFDMEENLPGVTCVAAPIFDPLARVIAALSISGPTTRMKSKLNAIKNDIRTSAWTIARRLAPVNIPRQSRGL
jgi:IclR family KDG regulon transcriptional repressor